MRDHLRILLGGEIHTLRDVDPTLTVLRFLRENHRLSGTKEGCAEGDCGACTVAVGERVGDRLVYRAINACIVFLATLDGKQLVTVEDIGQGGSLHPVQQAMVDRHGSQCGFCTPGIVMSMFALYHDDRQASRLTIQDAMAGNLCRCTGYGPIIQACEEACFGTPGDRFAGEAAATLSLLDSIAVDDNVCLETSRGRYLAPVELEQALQWRQTYPDACVLAGGTDVGLWVTKQHQVLDPVLYLGNLKALSGISISDSHLDIGALVTVADAMDAIAGYYPDFAELLRRFGAEQVRNLATMGGNIANGSPIGDSPPPLIAAGAELIVQGPAGQRRMALEDYFVAYGQTDLKAGELVTSIRLPRPGPDDRMACYKISKRFDQDISAVCAAFCLSLDDHGRVARFRTGFGGMAATPKRAIHLEQALIGSPWTHAAIEGAIDHLSRDFQPIDDLRASADYRLAVAGNLLRKFHLETGPAGGKTRLFGQSEHALGSR